MRARASAGEGSHLSRPRERSRASAGEGLHNCVFSRYFGQAPSRELLQRVPVQRSYTEVEFARDLRRHQTDAERRLWHHLRGRRFMGLRFRRQHPIGSYFADFACVELRLVIELDGSQHYSPDGLQRDAVRTDVLARNGFRVIRFSDRDVLNHVASVLEAIRLATSPHPALRADLSRKRER